MGKTVYAWVKYNLSNRNSRLIFILTVCIFVIITTVGSVSFYSTKNILQQEISEPQSHLLRLGMESVDGIIKDTDQVAIQIALNSIALTFLNKQTGQADYNTISSLVAYMDTLAVSPSIQSIYLYSVERDSIVASSPYGYSSNPNHFPDLAWLSSMDQLKHKPMYVTKRKMDNGQQIISLFRGITFNGGLTGVVAINLKWDFFFSKIFPDYVSKSGGTRLIYDQNNVLIYSLNDAAFPVDKFSGSYSRQDGSHISEFTSGGHDFAVTQVESDITRWKFVSAIPLAKLLDRISAVRNIVFAISAAAILFGTIAIYYFNYMAFKPVQRIKRILGSDDKNGVDLTELETSMIKLVNDHGSLALVVNQSKSELRSKLVQDLAAGRLGEKEIRSKWNQLFENWGASPLYMVLLSIDDYQMWSEPFPEEDRSLLKYAMANIVEELFTVHCRNVVIDWTKENLLVLVQPQEREYDENALLGDVRHVIQTIYSLLQISATAAVGGGSGGPEQIGRYVKEAAEALTYRLYQGYSSVILYSEAMEEDAFKELDERWKSDLFDRIEAGSTDEALHIIRRFTADAVEKTVKPSFVIGYFDDIVFSLKRHAGEQRWEKPDLLANHTEYAFATVSIDDIQIRLETIVCYIAEQYVRRQGSKEYRLVHSMIAFMKEHLHENIGVAEIGQSVGLGASSISQMFKQEMNITIYDYLTKLRIHKAEELLLTTDQRVTDIALQVGYANENSFIRSFRKLKEITPGKYREMMRKASNVELADKKSL